MKKTNQLVFENTRGGEGTDDDDPRSANGTCGKHLSIDAAQLRYEP